MDISLENPRPLVTGVLLAGLLIGLALLGQDASPVEAGRPQVLTPERWLAAGLTRRADAEIARLAEDAQTLRDALVADRKQSSLDSSGGQPGQTGVEVRPDAIRAMTLAQRIYAAHRAGTAATAPARQALIAAAEAVARYAAGGLERNTAVLTLNAALERIRAIAPATEDHVQGRLSAPEGDALTCSGADCDHSLVRARAFIPLALGGGAWSTASTGG